MNAYQAPTYSELNAVLDQARRPSSSRTPITDAQLLGLQQRWTTNLSARLDQAIEDAEYGKLAEAVAKAWQRLAAEQPVLRGVLDEGRRHSDALLEAREDEFRMLALAAGLITLNADERHAARLGREFLERATGVVSALHHVA